MAFEKPLPRYSCWNWFQGFDFLSFREFDAFLTAAADAEPDAVEEEVLASSAARSPPAAANAEPDALASQRPLHQQQP